MEALLVHGHARLALAALDFGQPGPLLLLPDPQLLQHALVVALHLLPFLQTDRGQRSRDTSAEPWGEQRGLESRLGTRVEVAGDTPKGQDGEAGAEHAVKEGAGSASLHSPLWEPTTLNPGQWQISRKAPQNSHLLAH